jgi:hypothetical protein
MTDWLLPEDVLREAPSYTPRPHELADLELLLSEAYQPRHRVSRQGRPGGDPAARDSG